MRDSTAFSKEEQIAGFVAFAVRGDRELLSLNELLIAVAGQPNAACRVHRLREPRAIDAPLRAATPQIGRAGKPLERELRQREVPRFRAQLLLPAHVAAGHGALLPIGEFYHPTPQRDARASGKATPAVGRENIGTQRSRSCALAPIVRPIRRARRHIAGVGPRDVAVGRAHAQPVVAALQHIE